MARIGTAYPGVSATTVCGDRYLKQFSIHNKAD